MSTKIVPVRTPMIAYSLPPGEVYPVHPAPLDGEPGMEVKGICERSPALLDANCPKAAELRTAAANAHTNFMGFIWNRSY
jgi:hypothetical protein